MFLRSHVLPPLTLLVSLICDTPLLKYKKPTNPKHTKVEFAISSMARLSREALSASFNSFLPMERDKRVKGGRAGSTGEAADGRNKGTKKGAAREANGRAGGDFLGGGRACFQRK